MGKQRLDITQVILNLDGTEAHATITNGSLCETCGQPLLKRKPFTLGTALVRCLTSDEIDPRTGRPIPAPGTVRYERVKLALRIEDATDEIGLSIDQIKDLKDLAPKFLSAVAQMRVWDILDPKDEDENEYEICLFFTSKPKPKEIPAKLSSDSAA